MQYETRLRLLKVALIVAGALSLLLYPMSVLWPAGFVWHGGGHSYYLQMIIGIYIVLGIFLLIAARRPTEHLSLIWFAVWSSVVHGGVMAVQAIMDPAERTHLYGDVPMLFAAAVVIGLLTPRAARIPSRST